jgi:hypothetical protein
MIFAEAELQDIVVGVESWMMKRGSWQLAPERDPQGNHDVTAPP